MNDVLEALGYIVKDMHLYVVHDEYYNYRVVVYANNEEEAIEKLHKWVEETKQNGKFWHSKDVQWYADLCNNDVVL